MVISKCPKALIAAGVLSYVFVRISSIFPIGWGVFKLVVSVVGSTAVNVKVSGNVLDLVELFGSIDLVLPLVASVVNVVEVSVITVSVDVPDLVEFFGLMVLVLPLVESPEETQESYQIFKTTKFLWFM